MIHKPDNNIILNHIKELSSDKMLGRSIRNGGAEKASAYISAVYNDIGLKIPEDLCEYYQHFSVEWRSVNKPGILYVDRIECLPEDFRIAAVGSGKVQGDLVFVGYGATCKGFDDYTGVDVKNKIVVALSGNLPRNDNEWLLDYDEYRILNAIAHGASAMLIIQDIPTGHGYKFRIAEDGPVSPCFRRSLEMSEVSNGFGWSEDIIKRLDTFTTAYISCEFSKRLFEYNGKDIIKIAKEMNDNGNKNSFVLKQKCELTADVGIRNHELANVIGVIPGTMDPHKHIIVGAHYDHVGIDEKTGGICHGADDNASGAAGMLELARLLNSAPQRYTILVVGFTGEENGYLGSSYYISNPVYPLKDTFMMIELDMIGRNSDNEIKISGTDGLLEEICKTAYRNSITATESQTGGDHKVFCDEGVNTILFWDGGSSDQHQVADTWEKISVNKISKIMQLIIEIIAGS